MPVPISPVSLKPETEQRKLDEGFEKARLEEKAANRFITESPDGTKVIEILRMKLFNRIERVLDEDPECKSLVEVLKELGATERIAKSAVEQLVKRYLHGPKQGVI